MWILQWKLTLRHMSPFCPHPMVLDLPKTFFGQMICRHMLIIFISPHPSTLPGTNHFLSMAKKIQGSGCWWPQEGCWGWVGDASSSRHTGRKDTVLQSKPNKKSIYIALMTQKSITNWWHCYPLTRWQDSDSHTREGHKRNWSCKIGKVEETPGCD